MLWSDTTYGLYPPEICPNVTVDFPSSSCVGTFAIAFRISAIINAIPAIASAPFSGILACAVIPSTLSSNQVLPLWAIWIIPEVGSISRTQSSFWIHPCCTAASDPFISASSSTVPIKTNVPGSFSISSAFSFCDFASSANAVNALASPDFISQAPRPQIFPSETSAPNAFFVHPSPLTTVSMWQINTSAGCAFAPFTTPFTIFLPVSTS